jgi:hypothetical protein
VTGRRAVPPLSDLAGVFGAPMGRTGDDLAGLRAVVLPATLDAGGYDAGGAYWGHGAPLWRTVVVEVPRGEAFTRAATFGAACEAFRGMFAGIQVMTDAQ